MIRVNEALNQSSVERFQQDMVPVSDSLVSWGRKADSCKNLRGFNNVRIPKTGS